MIRGTTAQFNFNMPCPIKEVEWVAIQFWQENNPSTLLPITKHLEDCCQPNELDRKLCVSLTAEETSLFSDKYKAYTQLRAKRSDGTIFGSRQILITVYPMNDNLIKIGSDDIGVTNYGYISIDSGTV
jgi:hypothetical protein